MLADTAITAMPQITAQARSLRVSIRFHSSCCTGGCACGTVRYEITEPLLSASYCHCTRCQRRTGTAASAQARVKPGSLTWTQGRDNIGAWTPEGGFSKAFCTSCGGQLYSCDPDDPDNTI